MGKLYLIPTPVGNMEDITLRALRLLKEVDLVLAEDTRTSAKLLKHYEITTPLLSHHKFNEHQQVDRIAERLERGENIALISDAGTPGISDPGFLLTRTCVERGIATECFRSYAGQGMCTTRCRCRMPSGSHCFRSGPGQFRISLRPFLF